MGTNREYKSLKLSFLNAGGLVTHGLDKTKDPHFINTMSKYNIVVLAETQMSKCQLPSIGNFHVHAVSIDQSLDITTLLVDFAFCVNMIFFHTLK